MVKKLADFITEAKKLKIKDAKVINPKDVVTAEWVRLKCQFGCGGYGGCLVCPPYSPTPETMRKVLDSYRYAVLLHDHDSEKINENVPKLERIIFLSGFYKCWGVGAGPCYLCERCNLKFCKHPYLARPSMEACGIDVFATARRHGFRIEVVTSRRSCENYFGLILVE